MATLILLRKKISNSIQLTPAPTGAASLKKRHGKADPVRERFFRRERGIPARLAFDCASWTKGGTDDENWKCRALSAYFRASWVSRWNTSEASEPPRARFPYITLVPFVVMLISGVCLEVARRLGNNRGNREN